MVGNVVEAEYDGVDVIDVKYDGENDRVDMFVFPRVESLTIEAVIKREE
jgi:hypothetical protein